MPQTILIADDDASIVKMIREELEAQGFRVLTAANGQMAMRMAQTQKPDLIVLDVAMPISTGLTAFRAIRNSPTTQKIPVIFMTGRPSAEVYPTVEQGTRVAHLKKPVDMVDLLEMIRRFLQEYPTK